MGEPERNYFIDLIKGILIILVIIGHFLPGTLSDNPVRYIIYSFHMPAFFYVSGMLYSGRTSLKEYGLRFGIPWLIAVHVYYVLTNLRTMSVGSYLRAYVTPYYHLWFVIGFLFCIVMVRACKENKRVLLCIGIALAFLSCILKGKDFTILKFIDHTIRPQHLLFFTLGILRKNKGGTVKRAIIPAVLFIIFLHLGFKMQEAWWEQLGRYALLCGVLYNIDLWKYNIKPSVIGILGRMTYPVYLWHVIGKLGALYITDGEYNLLYYICAGIYTLVFIVALRLNKNENIRFLVGR